MSKRRATLQDRCPKCRINYRLCFCDQITSIETNTNIKILMHIREKYLTSNTANLAELALGNCQIHTRGELDNPLNIEELISDPENTFYLFPDDSAIELNEDFMANRNGPITILVPDGSWRQAKKVKKREVALQKLQSVKLPVGGPKSKYHLRQEPNQNSVCTYEAIARTIGIIEGKEKQDHLENIFDVMVERVMISRATPPKNI